LNLSKGLQAGNGLKSGNGFKVGGGLKIGNWQSKIENNLWLNTKKDLF
jgi:hypothetical protein